MTQHILLAGSTGLVGKHVASALEKNPGTSLISLVRHKSSAHGQAIDFEQLCEAPVRVLESVGARDINIGISCLGTTQKTAGSQAGLFRVDHDYVLAMARGAKELGARHFILVTAAWAGGPGFYLKTKGQIERSLADLNFDRVDIIRPGFLIGERNHRRVGEEIGQHVAAMLSFLFVGPLAQFGIIPAQTVAKAIVAATRKTTPGQFVHENNDIRRLAAASSEA